MLIRWILGDFEDLKADFTQFCKKGIYGDLLEYFGVALRRIRESVVEEIRISLYRDQIEAIQNVLKRSREDI